MPISSGTIGWDWIACLVPLRIQCYLKLQHLFRGSTSGPPTSLRTSARESLYAASACWPTSRHGDLVSGMLLDVTLPAIETSNVMDGSGAPWPPATALQSRALDERHWFAIVYEVEVDRTEVGTLYSEWIILRVVLFSCFAKKWPCRNLIISVVYPEVRAIVLFCAS